MSKKRCKYGTMLQLALSRTREYNADLGAAELMGDSEALASALSKMDTYHNRLFRNILCPGYARKAGSSLLRTHLPTKERIIRLLEIRNQRPQSITDVFFKPHDNRYRRTICAIPQFKVNGFKAATNTITKKGRRKEIIILPRP